MGNIFFYLSLFPSDHMSHFMTRARSEVYAEIPSLNTVLHYWQELGKPYFDRAVVHSLGLADIQRGLVSVIS